jgi:tetratricopeptide (TPR) repeat protein
VQRQRLGELAQEARRRGIPTVVLDPPSGEDAAHRVVIDTLSQLREQDCWSAPLGRVVGSQQPWGDMLKAFGHGIESLRSKPVFVLYSPSLWHTRDPDDSHWNEETEQVKGAILQYAPMLVYTGNYLNAMPMADRMPLAGDLDQRRFLDEQFAKGPLAPAARHVGSACPGLDRANDLQLRLLVAVRHVTGAPTTRLLPVCNLVQQLGASLAGAAWVPLRDAWHAVSLVRRPFGWEALKSLFASPLDGDSEAVLKQCLMDRDPSERHVLLVHPDDIPSTELPSRLHHRCLDLYQRQLRQTGTTDPDRWRFGLEAGHHASAAALWDEIKELPRPLFPGQYSIYGKRASLAAQASGDDGTFQIAVHFFEQALAVDEQDDYAHHYLAYNLDYAALDEDRSDRHYRRAIDLAPRWPWWHARYVRFLITTGRLSEAREAWSRALDDLSDGMDADPEWVCRSCHIWVLRLLLHRSQLDFAAEVLADIPAGCWDAIPGVHLLAAMLASMRDAEAGLDVYPLDVPLEERWIAPRLLREAERQRGIERWFAGRIEDVGNRSVRALLAEPAAVAETTSYFHSEIAMETFEKASETRVAAVSEGDYFEFYVFAPDQAGGEPTPLIRFARQDARTVFQDRGPDPRRYLRRKGWIGGESGTASPA